MGQNGFSITRDHPITRDHGDSSVAYCLWPIIPVLLCVLRGEEVLPLLLILLLTLFFHPIFLRVSVSPCLRVSVVILCFCLCPRCAAVKVLPLLLISCGLLPVACCLALARRHRPTKQSRRLQSLAPFSKVLARSAPAQLIHCV